MNGFKHLVYKFAFGTLLRMPDAFYSVLFTITFPIYRALHKERAYGRVVRHLDSARKYTGEMLLEIASPSARNDESKALSVRQVEQLARDMFYGIYRNALDSYRGLSRFRKVEKRIVFENEDIIRDAIAECSAAGKPIAAISIHQGAFELLHRSLCRYSEHVHLITDSVGDPAFRKCLQELRGDPHLKEYHPEETGKLIRDLFKTRGILAMVVDQGKHTKGNTVKLFGQESTLYLRLPQKVNQMGAGIVTFRTWTEYGNREHPEKPIVIRFEKYYPPRYDETRLVTEIAEEVEKWIGEHPDQWSWNYHGNFKVN